MCNRDGVRLQADEAGQGLPVTEEDLQEGPSKVGGGGDQLPEGFQEHDTTVNCRRRTSPRGNIEMI